MNVFKSPTFMTWSSMFVRSFSPLVIIPFGLISNTENDVALYLLLIAVIQFSYFIDLGFNPTLARFIAYAISKKNKNKKENNNQIVDSKVPKNVNLLPVIKLTNYVYNFFALVVLIIILIFQFLISDAESFKSETLLSSYAWNSLLFGMPILIWGLKYSVFLTGTNNIHIEQKVAFIIGTISILFQIGAMIISGKLLIIFIIMIIFEVINVFVKRFLSNMHCFEDDIKIKTKEIILKDHIELIKNIYSSVWRQGSGVLLGYGVGQLSLIILVSGIGAAASASVLLATRYLNFTILISNVPFYVKVPIMSALRSNSNHFEADSIAKQRISYSLLLLVLGFVATFLILPYYLSYVESSVKFISINLWIFLSVGAFFERMGAMQLMIMATHNVIYAHKAALSFAFPFIAVLFFTNPVIGINSYGVAFLVGNFSYFCYSLFHLSKFIVKRNSFIFQSLKYPIIALLIVLILGVLKYV